jgi:predicted PurR-regulated permease PerM
MAPRAGASVVSQAANWILVALASLWFLRAARSVLIPIALAVLISYALEPVVAWLERRHVHRALASAIVLFMVVGAAAAGVYSLKDDAARLAEALPTAAERARSIVTSQLGSGLEAVNKATAAIGRESSNEGGRQAPTATSGHASGSWLERAVSAIFALAGHLVIIVFFVFFLLMSGHHVRNRLVEVMGPDPDDRRATAALIDEINAQIQRYLLVLLFTGAVVGVSTWLVLLWVGVQQAAMWGLLAGVFNSIPYFGPVIVSGGLFVVGLVEGSLTQALQMSGAAVIITSLEGWLLTPPLMGKVERMSSLVVFIGLLLWTWVWGAWGTVLAIPMLVIIKSTADHVPRLRPLGRLMAP